MMTIAIVLGVFLVLLIFGCWSSRSRVRRARAQGLYPSNPSTATTEDLRRLAEAGQKILAIKLYRQIHRVGLKEAKETVEALLKGKGERQA
jgi:ribosomal protein L7/L12